MTEHVPLSSREKILDVAEALFARRGFAGVGLREVAESAGLGKSSLFHHVRSKVQLYCEVMDRVLARIQARLGSALEAVAGPVARLDAWIDGIVDGLAEHPTSARLLLRGLFEDEAFPARELPPEARAVEERLARILQQIHALLRDGVEAGVFRRVSVPHTVQTLIGATVYHFASGDLGEGVLGRPLLSAEAIRSRKQELKNLLHQGLAATAAV